MNNGILLRALEGSNPLAFLAALGTLRLLHLHDPRAGARMRWERSDGFWRPRLQGLCVDEAGLTDRLIDASWAPVETFSRLGKNLRVPRQDFAPFVKEAHGLANRQDRRAADFAAAFGCETCEDKKKDRIRFTDFCFITGSGHQDFLGSIGELARRVTSAHIHDALFGQWRVDKTLSMRWDPTDASEYALRWDDPSSVGAWAVWGANRLAAEALPYFPALPAERGLRTTGFARRNGRNEFTWPIWTRFAGFDSVRSLLSFHELQSDAPNRDKLRAMGIEELYRAERVRIGQGANFKVSFRPARGV
jgi:hypothetical protein